MKKTKFRILLLMLLLFTALFVGCAEEKTTDWIPVGGATDASSTAPLTTAQPTVPVAHAIQQSESGHPEREETTEIVTMMQLPGQMEASATTTEATQPSVETEAPPMTTAATQPPEERKAQQIPVETASHTSEETTEPDDRSNPAMPEGCEGEPGEGETQIGYTPKTSYIANTNTKKFHVPDCSSVKDMKEKNRWDFTGTREELIQQGYQPCKRCNP